MRRKRLEHLTGTLRTWVAREPLRIYMAGIVILTGTAGFVFSVVLLACGVTHMWLRYPLATAGAYVTFLLLVRAWLAHQRARLRDESRVFDHFDALDVLPIPDLEMSSAAPEPATFGGGQFGGGGAGAHFGDAVAPSEATPAGLATSSTESVASQATRRLADAIDLDELWLIVVPIVMGVVLLVTGLYFVWLAPAILGDLLLDGLIAHAMYRRLRLIDERHWLGGAVRRTWIPAVGLVVTLAVAGYCAERLLPGADSIGDLFRALET